MLSTMHRSRASADIYAYSINATYAHHTHEFNYHAAYSPFLLRPEEGQSTLTQMSARQTCFFTHWIQKSQPFLMTAPAEKPSLQHQTSERHLRSAFTRAPLPKCLHRSVVTRAPLPKRHHQSAVTRAPSPKHQSLCLIDYNTDVLVLTYIVVQTHQHRAFCKIGKNWHCF